MTEIELQEDVLGEAPPGITGAAEQNFFNKDHADHQHKMRKLEIGWVGWPFGGGVEKAGNIAMITIFLCLIISASICFHVDIVKNPDLFIKIVSPFLSIVTLALGYLFGASKRD